MSDLSAVFAIPVFAIATAIWAELLGVPTAWLKLRRTAVWEKRSRKARRIDLLSGFVGGITGLSAIFGGLVGAAMWIGVLVT